MARADAVSWLLPVRDGGRWLEAAVDSARTACRPIDEVVVVDDGSEDGAADRLPSDVRVVRQAPLGIVAALNRGLEICRNPLIARLDADDTALPGRLEAQRALLAARPDVAAVGGRATLLSEDGAVGMRRYVAWVNGLRDPMSARLVESPLFHPAATYRAEAVRRVGGYRDGDLPEDYDLWLRLVEAGHALANVPEVVVALRDRPDRLTRTDPRYARAAFDRCKQEHLARTLLREPRRVLLWGAGKRGRPWLRWLIAAGHEVPAVIDLREGVRQGKPVLTEAALPELRADLLLVAVGARGARAHIRQRIAARRPDWREGRDWFAVA